MMIDQQLFLWQIQGPNFIMHWRQSALWEALLWKFRLTNDGNAD
jgi:hypothetical protein